MASLKYAIRAHHFASAILFFLAFDMALRLAIACYGLTVGLVYLALRMTRKRNLRYQLP
jgi:hypothetical protein